ncbi:hypothetical protein VOI54_12395 [Tamlana sp. 2201CG12-4]|uniref:hypothetical protein n=1 Tax=Tamlana sp. 2201CG12-4 TaxID=3112582 RepID=UPI002DB61B6F|nr:hypothetical protein [Tamlana sp. 2201CG12-4]MEC3907821.1 hypothetical protein [Tamlana sp. 2201CG12-4]
MRIKKYIRYLFGIVFLVFVLNKLYLRSWILKNKPTPALEVITYSIPNLIEAIMGTIALTGIILRLKDRFQIKINDAWAYVISTCISSIYVISQELKFHNIGGNNTYDFNDLMASIIGLIVTLGLLLFLGFREKSS